MKPPIKTAHDQFMENTFNENIEFKKENKEIKQDTINLSYLIDELSNSVDNTIKYGNRMTKLAKFSVGLNLILAAIITLNFILEYL